MVFGVSDGLVSNVALILGVAGATPTRSAVVIAGLAGLVGGSVSMAAGEYISMQAQKELVERELSVEAEAIATEPEKELEELVSLYVTRGFDRETATMIGEKVMADPKLALEVHAREELGVEPTSLGSPIQAAWSSFLAFTLGAAIPIIPWLFAIGTVAVVTSVCVGLIAAATVGGLLGRFTERSIFKSSVRQVLVMAFSCLVSFGIGSLVGQGIS